MQNALACGTEYAKKIGEKGRASIDEKICMTPPTNPQELYYKCVYSDGQIFSAALAAAFTFMKSVGAVLIVFMLVYAHKILDVHGFEDFEVDSDDSDDDSDYKAAAAGGQAFTNDISPGDVEMTKAMTSGPMSKGREAQI